MDQKRLNEIVTALKSKGVNLSCPRCGKFKFSVLGEAKVTLEQTDMRDWWLFGARDIPTAIIACDNCGYITQHATITLGLAKGKQT